MDDIQKRRDILQTQGNPNRPYEYIAELSHSLSRKKAKLEITVRYIPDRAIISRGVFATYLKYIEKQKEESLEALAGIIFEDMNNELIPYWIHLSLQAHDEKGHHEVTLEDRQPNWDNQMLLKRIKAI